MKALKTFAMGCTLYHEGQPVDPSVFAPEDLQELISGGLITEDKPQEEKKAEPKKRTAKK